MANWKLSEKDEKEFDEFLKSSNSSSNKVSNSRIPSWDLADEDSSAFDLALNKFRQDNQLDAKSIIQRLNQTSNSINKTLSGNSYIDRNGRLDLKSQIYDYENDLKRLKAYGYDTSEALGKVGDIRKASDGLTKYYSHFKDENEYSAYINSDFYKNQKLLSDISGAADYEQNSVNKVNDYGVLDYTTDTPLVDNLGVYLRMKELGTTKPYDVEASTMNKHFGSDVYGSSYEKAYKNNWNQLTDEEIKAYYYLYNTQGLASAKEYLAGLNNILGQRKLNGVSDAYNDANALSKVFMNASTIPLNVVGGLSALNEVMDSITSGEKINPYAPGMMGANFNSTIRGLAAQDINNATHNIALPSGFGFGDAYQSVMSGLDSALGVTVFGPAYTSIMGVSAFATTAAELTKRGANDLQIIAGGTAAGIAETFFEQFSIENLISMKTDGTIKTALKNIAKQMGIEASEEFFTELANIASDAIIMQDKSELQEYLNNGGIKEAIAQTASRLANAALGGAIAGGFSATAHQVGGSIAGNIEALSKYGNLNSQSNLINEGLSYDENTNAYKFAKNASDKMVDGKNLSGRDLRIMEEANASARSDVQKGNVSAYAYRRLSYLGETGDVQTIANAIAKLAKGESVSKSELNAINNSKYGIQTLTEMAGGKFYSNVKENTQNNAHSDTYTKQDIVASKMLTDSVTEADNAKVTPPTPAENVNKAEPIKPTANTQQDDDEEKDVTAEIRDKLTGFNLEDTTAKTIELAYKPEYGSVNDYVLGVLDGYNFGLTNQNYNDPNTTSDNYAKLPENVRKFAYTLGQQSNTNADNARVEVINKGKNGKTGRRIGTVRGEGVNLKELGERFGDSGSKLYNILADTAEITGIDIVVYKSNTDADGNFIGAQGMYNGKKNPFTIYVDINAGLKNIKDAENFAKYALLRAFTHEFVHFCENWSPVEYSNLRRVVFEEMNKRGENVHDLIQDEIRTKKGNISYDKASKEIVAEALVEILPETSFQERLIKEHKNIFQKLFERLKEFLKDIKDYFENLAGLSIKSGRKVNAVREEVDGAYRYVQSVVDAMNKVAYSAIENMQANFAVDEGTGDVVVEETPITEEEEIVSSPIAEAVNENITPIKSAMPTEIHEAEEANLPEVSDVNSEDPHAINEIAWKIMKAVKKQGMPYGIKTTNNHYFVGIGAILARVDKATFDAVDKEYYLRIIENNTNIEQAGDVCANKIEGNVYATRLENGGMEVIVYGEGQKQVVLNKRYANFFDGLDFYYSDLTKKTAPLAIKNSSGEMVGIIMGITTKVPLPTEKLELAKFKSFNKKGVDKAKSLEASTKIANKVLAMAKEDDRKEGYRDDDRQFVEVSFADTVKELNDSTSDISVGVRVTRPKFLIGKTSVIARVGSATMDWLVDSKAIGLPSRMTFIKNREAEATNKLKGNAYNFVTREGKTKAFLFVDGDKQIVVDQKFFKPFAGYDYYYSDDRKTIVAKDANGDTVGIIGTIVPNYTIDTNGLELAKIKGFNEPTTQILSAKNPTPKPTPQTEEAVTQINSEYNDKELAQRVKYDPSVPVTEAELERIRKALVVLDKDIDFFLMEDNGMFSGYDERKQEFYSKEHTVAEIAEFLKNEYKDGGSSAAGMRMSHSADAKGMKFNNSFVYGKQNGRLMVVYGADRLVSWGDLAKRKLELIAKEEATPTVSETKPETVDVENGSTSSERVANALVDTYLSKGQKFSSMDLYAICDKAFGGTQAEGKYDRKDAYDAMELAVNKQIVATMSKYNTGEIANALEGLHQMQAILELLPTQNVRTEEQEQFQQFSTPPNIAYLASWVAKINSSDHMLEPSAGIGGIASFAKAWGATVTVNELSKRRLEVLRSMGFDNMFNENAEHIDNILPDTIQPSVIVMNPPFSATAGRVSTKKTSNAELHINSALDRLAEGGRLVAILGRGMADDKYSKYWNQIRKDYTIRANFSIDGNNYKKYGTTFDVQLVVIDKIGPQTGATLTGTFTDLSDIMPLLKGVRDERSAEVKFSTDITSNQESTVATKGDGAVSVPVDSADNSVDGGRKSSNGTESRDTGESGSNNNNIRTSDGVSEHNQLGTSHNEGNVRSNTKNSESKDGRKDTGAVSESVGNDSGESGYERGGLGEQSSRSPEVGRSKERSDDGVFADYVAPKLTVSGSKGHPAALVESSAMSSVGMPPAVYKPQIPENVIKNNLSTEQMVSITYAGQAHEQMLNSGKRKGFFIGDGTGVGKGRQISGIILDNFMQGRKRAVWVSKNNNLFVDAVRDWTETTGRSKDEVHDFSKIKLEDKIDIKEGILFTTYDTLRSEKGTKSRLQQIIDWLGKDFDGVIAFDEAHNMGNVDGAVGKRGKTKGSGKALKAVELQNSLPNARVVYVSATGATEVSNLAYAERLGLWGAGTAFTDKNDFVTKIGSAGLSAMELVVRDMKSMGVYVARSISYNGVSYDTIQHELTPDQTFIYNTMCKAWQSVMDSVLETMQRTNANKNPLARQRAIGNFYSSMQRFYNQVLTSMSMPSVVADIKKQLADNKSVVLQIVNTNQAQADREIAAIKAENGSLDDMDLTPRGQLLEYLKNNYPIYLFEEVEDEDGHVKSEIVTDASGNPVIDKKAVKARDELIELVNDMSIPDGPLEILFDAFGTENVAEITGRTRRVVPRKMPDGSIRRVEESRGKTHTEADVNAFNKGDKRILVFSDAGGTGKSYHASRTVKNQQQRVHYVLQPGWSASNAVQGFGRTNRSNQSSAPIYKLVTTNIKGQKRFTSTIARRLDQLGALTKGQRDSGSGMFGAKDNLETDLARDALREFYVRLIKNKIDGIEPKDLLKKLGLSKKFTDQHGWLKIDDASARDMSLFLNRILSLEVDEQNKVFDEFIGIYDYMLDEAAKNGTLDTGMENVKADKVEIIDSEVIYTQKGTGAETKYVQAKVYTKPHVIKTVEAAKNAWFNFEGIYKTDSDEYRAVFRIADKTTQTGSIVKQYRLIGPNRAKWSTWVENTLNNKAKPVPKEEWDAVWAEEVAKVPEYNEEIKHMLTGALLPIWNILPNEGNTKVQRLIADDGESYLGRIIESNVIDGLLRRFNVGRTKETFNAEIIKTGALKEGKIFNLTYNRAKIKRSKVSGEWRLEYAQLGNTWSILRNFPDMINEKISWETRYFIPLNEKGDKIIEKLLEENPVANVSDEDAQEQSRDYLDDDSDEFAFDADEYRIYKEAVQEIRQGMFGNKTKLVDGYIIDVGNKLIYNNGDYVDNYSSKIVMIEADEDKFIEDKLTIVKEAIKKYEQQGAYSIGDRTDIKRICAMLAFGGFEFNIKQRFIHNSIPYAGNDTEGKGKLLPFSTSDTGEGEGSSRDIGEGNYIEPVYERYNLIVSKRSDPKVAKKLERFVKIAAKYKDYKYEAWHGTRETFRILRNDKKGTNTNTEISKGWFFAADKETANSYYPYGVMKYLAEHYPKMYSEKDAEDLKVKGNLYHYFIKMKKPLVKDLRNYDYESHKANKDAWVEFTKEADEKGCDGIILRHAMDNQLKTGARESTVYLFKDPNQAKSADIVTFDVAGNILPLEARFDETYDDTQYQDRSESLTDLEVLEMGANQINVDTLTDGEKFALETFQKRISELNQLRTERKELGTQYKEQQFGKNVDREGATETLNRMHVLDGKIQKAEADVLDIQDKKVLKSVLHKARKVVEQAEREHGKELLQRWRDRRNNADAIKKYRDRITADVEELSQWILKPDNKEQLKRVPDVLKNSIVEFISYIDFSSKRQLKGGTPTKKDTEFIRNLNKLKDAMVQNISVTGLYSGYNDLPPNFMDDLQKYIDKMQAFVNNYSEGFVINQMTGAELKELSKIVRVVKKYIKQMNAFHANAMFQHVEDSGNDTISFLKAYNNAGNVGTISNFVLWQQIRPAYAFERFGNGGISIEHEFREAQATLAFHSKEIIDFANEAYTDAEVKAWSEEYREFEIGGDTVRIPIAYIMGIYELYKQEDSKRHLLGDGMRVATYTQGRTKVSDTGHEITQAQIEEIIGTLTPRQKEVADKLQKFMATVGAKWGNYVSIARFGEELFTNPQYYPINSDGRHLESNADEAPSNASLYALLNMSFTKSRVEEADNRIVIYNIFDVFANHMASMAQYNAFALPVLDALKWFNYKQVVVDAATGKKTVITSVREQLARVYGVAEERRPGKGNEGYAETFIKNIIKAYNGTETQGIPTDAYGFNALRRYNMAQIAYNLRVVVQQPMAILRAAMLVDYASLVKGLAMTPAQVKANIEEMNAHSGIAAWKSLGFYDINISRGLTETIKHNRSVMEKVNEVGMFGAEKADEITWAAMWNACKVEVAKKNRYTVGSENFYKEVTALFEEVIYKTQVVDSVLTKNEFMRSKGFFSRTISSFMSEPVTSASMLIDAYYKYSMDLQKGMSKSQAWQKNAKNIGRTLIVYSISAIILAAVQAVIDGMRDDDDDQTYGEKWVEAFAGNVIDELMPFNKLPILSDFYDIAKEIVAIFGVDTYGNPPQTIIAQWYNSLIKGIQIMYMKLNGQSTGYTYYAGIQKLLQAVAGISGLPIAALTREVVNAWNATAGALNKDLIVHSYEAGNADMNRYFKAVESGDNAKAKAILNEIIEKKKEDIANSRKKDGKTELSSEELEKEARSRIKSSVTTHYSAKYVEAYKKNDTSAMADIRRKVFSTGLYGTVDDVIKTMNNWIKEYK